LTNLKQTATADALIRLKFQVLNRRTIFSLLIMWCTFVTYLIYVMHVCHVTYLHYCTLLGCELQLFHH